MITPDDIKELLRCLPWFSCSIDDHAQVHEIIRKAFPKEYASGEFTASLEGYERDTIGKPRTPADDYYTPPEIADAMCNPPFSGGKS